jgi:hypothetical protein
MADWCCITYITCIITSLSLGSSGLLYYVVRVTACQLRQVVVTP